MRPSFLRREPSGQIAEETGERVDTAEYHSEMLSHEAFQKLETLRRQTASILAACCIQVLDEPILNLPMPGLKANSEVFLEGRLRVRDAFFFRGV